MVYNAGQSFVLAGVESSFNTPVTANKSLGIIGSIDSGLSNSMIDVRDLGDRELASLLAGNFDGKITVDGTMNSGAIFEMFFGQSTDAATSSDYKHTFINHDSTEVLQNVISSYTIQENYDATSDVTLKYGGCKCNSFNIGVNLNEVVTIGSEFMVADVDTGTTSGTKVSTTTVPFTFANCSLSVGNVASETVVATVQSAKFSFGNNLVRVGGIGSRLAQEFIPGIFTCTGEFTMLFSDKTMFERFLGGTAATSATPTTTGVIFQATNGVTLGSGRTELYIYGEGQFGEGNHTISTDGVVELTIPFTITTLRDVYTVDAVATYF